MNTIYCCARGLYRIAIRTAKPHHASNRGDKEVVCCSCRSLVSDSSGCEAVHTHKCLPYTSRFYYAKESAKTIVLSSRSPALVSRRRFHSTSGCDSVPIATHLNRDFVRKKCKSAHGVVLQGKKRDVCPLLIGFNLSCRSLSHKMSADDVLQGLDETQVKLMQEECILVDENDKNIGSASKKTCHLLQNINQGMLHRAFSVFLFNTKGQLLLQQRASAKITFPDHFTNTCCSHPLNFEAELEEMEALGVKRAARRKLKHELGIEPEQLPLEDFHYLTRILYKAENIPKDNKWGEHEIDYILFIQKDVKVIPNPNEVKSHRYVSQQELKNLMNTATTDGLLITPWFRLIVQTFLYGWWNSLSDIQNHTDRNTIHNMVKS